MIGFRRGLLKTVKQRGGCCSASESGAQPARRPGCWCKRRRDTPGELAGQTAHGRGRYRRNRLFAPCGEVGTTTTGQMEIHHAEETPNSRPRAGDQRAANTGHDAIAGIEQPHSCPSYRQAGVLRTGRARPGWQRIGEERDRKPQRGARPTGPAGASGCSARAICRSSTGALAAPRWRRRRRDRAHAL